MDLGVQLGIPASPALANGEGLARDEAIPILGDRSGHDLGGFYKLGFPFQGPYMTDPVISGHIASPNCCRNPNADFVQSIKRKNT